MWTIGCHSVLAEGEEILGSLWKVQSMALMIQTLQAAYDFFYLSKSWQQQYTA